MSRIVITGIKLKDIDEELVRSEVAIYPGIRQLYAVRFLLGGDYVWRFPWSNWTPEITVKAQPVHDILEPVAVRTLVEKALNPGLMVFSAKEVAFSGVLVTVPIPAAIPLFSLGHGYSVTSLEVLFKGDGEIQYGSGFLPL